ncbi:hypothetical protein DLAC_08421 [Tieghemostelium lacteum]|uniref:Uncharacterized protein n=1 Tax=Tieghemostelium lacteum TaxID=361077 RepID=A0A151ZC49_TIELA|nr:hypothetical protein DLAC_08421 [Tieghemostelium lacteum]|eukprot:KYQ91454.1 hypothetical protein DLAC_08421 [Tieghemostelium lacteum]
MKFNLLLLFILLFINYLNCEVITEKENSIQFITLPRYNFKHESVSKNFDLNSKDYKESLIVLSFPGIILGVGILILGVIALTIRNLCFGNKKSVDGAETDETFSETGSYASEIDYSAYRREKPSSCIMKFVKSLIFFIILTSAVAIILGFTSDSMISNRIDEFFENLHESASEGRDLIRLIVNSLGSATDEKWRVNSKLFMIQIQLNGALETTENADLIQNNLNSLRVTLFTMGNILAILTCAWAIFSMVNAKAWSFLFLAYLSILCLLVQFLVLGIHVPLSATTNDLCDSIDDFDNPPNWIKSWYHCEDDTKNNIGAELKYVETEMSKILTSLNSYSLNYTHTRYTFSNITDIDFQKLRNNVPVKKRVQFDNSFSEDTITILSSIPKLNDLTSCRYIKNYITDLKLHYCHDLMYVICNIPKIIQN